MEQNINIKHRATSLFQRYSKILVLMAIVICVFVLVIVVANGFDKFLNAILLPIFLFSVYMMHELWKNKFYLTDFISNSKTVQIRYYKWNKEIEKVILLEDIKVNLKSTSTRFGFNCDLVLIVGNTKFIINDRFDWTSIEMSETFRYTKFYKNEPLTNNEKFILSKIIEKTK